MPTDKLTDKQKLLARLLIAPDELSTAQLLALLQTRAGDDEPEGPGAPTDPNVISPYRQAWIDELADELPLEVILKARKTLPATPTRDEIRQMLEAPSLEDRTGPRDRLIMRTLYATGIRLAELCALKFCDLDYGGQSVFVRDGKGAKDRYVLADAQTMAMLKEWQGDQGPEAPVFDVGDRQIERLVTEYGKQTGLTQKYAAMDRGLSPHSFRHAYATHLYETGVDLFTLKRWMGHAYLDVTENYIETSVKRTLSEYEGNRSAPLVGIRFAGTETPPMKLVDYGNHSRLRRGPCATTSSSTRRMGCDPPSSPRADPLPDRAGASPDAADSNLDRALGSFRRSDACQLNQFV